MNVGPFHFKTDYLHTSFFYLIMTLEHKRIYLIYFKCKLSLYFNRSTKINRNSHSFYISSSFSSIESYIIQFNEISIEHFENLACEDSTIFSLISKLIICDSSLRTLLNSPI